MTKVATKTRSETDSEPGSSASPDVLQDALADPLAEHASVDAPSAKKKPSLAARFKNGFKAIGKAIKAPGKKRGDKRRANVRETANGIPNSDIVYEQLAHAGAYGKLDAKKLPAWGYREAQVIDDTASGFRAVLYLPSAQALSGGPDAALSKAIHGGVPAPVLALRGTANMKGVKDDVTLGGVGSYQFRTNRQTISQMLGMAGGGTVVVGHSLGGALAQQTAVHLRASVGS